MTRTTLIFTGKEQLELISEPLPSPGPGQILVQTTKSLISTGTEGIVFSRNFAPGTHWDDWVKYPFRPGYLNAGKVVAIGEGVSHWKLGDRVASRGPHSSHHLLSASTPEPGGQTEFTPTSVGIPIPDGVSDEQATWMGLGKIVQVGVRAAEHVMGDTVVVVGLGLLGQLVVQYARLLGASQVIAIDNAPLRLELAASHGATLTLNSTAADALAAVRAATGDGADVVYDVTGHASVLATALPLARKHGKLLLLGDAGTPSLQTLTPDVVTRGVRIIGAHDMHPPQFPNPYVRWSAVQMYDLFLTYVQRNQIRVSDLITHRFPPTRAQDAWNLLTRDRQNAMGVVYDWT